MTWSIGGIPIGRDPQATYRVAIGDFLLMGGEPIFQERGILKKRGSLAELRAMTLRADGIELDEPDREIERRPDLLGALIDTLIAAESKPDIIPVPQVLRRDAPNDRRPSEVNVAKVLCGMVPTDDGSPTFPAPPIGTASPGPRAGP